MIPEMAPEFRLLCLAARRSPCPEALSRSVSHWKAVETGARRHRMAGGLHAILKGDGRAPAGLVERLWHLTLIEAARCQDLARDLAGLSRAFAAADIPMMVLKGIPLSLVLYGIESGRGAGDMDLLVAPADLPRADALLRRCGYVRKGAAILDRGHSLCLRRIKDIVYHHPQTRRTVELHQRLTENPHLLPWAFQDLWPEREMVAVADGAVATLPRRLLPLYLCVHGASHCWERLRWLADLADLLRAPGAVGAALAEAEAAGLGRPMKEALALCHHWLGLAVMPGQMASPEEVAPFVRRFFQGRRWNMAPRPGSREWLRRHSLWGRLYRLSLRSGPRYRLWELSALLIWPPDWEVIALPDALFWLYPLLRPLGWWRRRRAARLDGKEPRI